MKTARALLLALVASAALANHANAEACNTKEAAILIARDAVAEREQWPNGADYNVSRDESGWRVTACRIDYPTHKGSARYADGAFRTIVISSEGALKKYSR